MTVVQNHLKDENGNPAGGSTEALGLRIEWQKGPILEAGGRNGAFVEEVIEAAIGRIEFYQASKFHSLANAAALGHLRAAAEVLAERTRERQDRGVEGTHTV